MRTSQSRIVCRRRCQNQHYYKYVENIERRVKKRDLMRGSIIHEMIEVFIHGEDPWKILKIAERKYKKLFREEQEEYGDLPKMLQQIMEGYFRWWKKDPMKYYVPKKGWSMTEQKIILPFVEDIEISLIVDAFGKTRDKLRWLVDHKSKNRIPSELPHSDVQTAIYLWALDQEGVHLDGVAWNYILAKAPTQPELLKNGEMSRKKNIRTTWAVYRQALLDAGLKPRDYKDMKEQLEDKEFDFFVRLYLPRNDTMIKTLVEDAKVTALDIRDNPNARTRNLGRHCEWCDYEGLCMAELRGHDTDQLRRIEFKERGRGKEEKKYEDKRRKKRLSGNRKADHTR